MFLKGHMIQDSSVMVVTYLVLILMLPEFQIPLVFRYYIIYNKEIRLDYLSLPTQKFHDFII